MPEPAQIMMIGTFGSAGGWKRVFDGRTATEMRSPGSSWAR